MTYLSKAGRATMTRRTRLAAIAIAVLAGAVAVAPAMLAAQTSQSAGAGASTRPARVASWAAMPQDAVLDFDRTVRDPREPRQLLPDYDVGDHLHLNPTGYGAIADAVPVGLWR